MKKLIAVLIVMLILPITGCKQKSQPPKVDYALKQMVLEWTQLMGRHGIEYADEFNDIEYIRVVNAGALGDGVHAGESNRQYHTISIDVNNFKEGYWSTRNTVYHELGHYVFGLEHNDTRLDIMNTNTTSEIVCKQNWVDLASRYVETIKAHGGI